AGGGDRNREWTKGFVEPGPGVSEEMVAILNDAQTSGGILMTVAADRAEGILGELHAAGVTAAGIIGEVIDGPSGTVEVVA
ncbi:MAG: selenide, water dikinase SelD, partial [Nitrospinaceae bacterium]|nr:selenide, water dikinase SelD [Nitrospinaceae bacterium]